MLFFLICFLKIVKNKGNFSTNAKNEKHSIAVTTEVPICSELGIELMQQGGNAMDAAIGTAICVGIINSFSSGLGGGGFLMVKKSTGLLDVETVDFRETTPSNVNAENYRGRIDTSKKGGFAVAVPGEIKGLHFSHIKYGKLPWKQLFIKNIKIAKSFTVTYQLEKRLLKLKNYIMKDPGLKEIYTRNGVLVKEGDVISRTNYAETLEKIANNPESFYNGEIAQSIVSCVRANGGVITLKDLKNYQVKTPEPLRGSYKDNIVYTTNLPTAGPLLLEGLNILESFELKEIQEIGAAYEIYPEYHLLVEIFKFMSAKRSDLGDQEYTPNTENVVQQIVSKSFAKKLSESIKFDRSLSIKEYGYEKPFVEDYGTTHLNTYDKNGMIVLLTSTINLEFGAKFMDRKTGIIFNNEIDDFYIPSVKNAFDLPASNANIIAAGKRPFSSAAPLLMINSKRIIAIGASGGTRIPTSILNAFFHLELGDSLSDAINQPRLHHQIIPYITYVEKTLNPSIKHFLELMGNEVKVSSLNSIFTAVQGMRIFKHGKNTYIEAVADKRKGGTGIVA